MMKLKITEVEIQGEKYYLSEIPFAAAENVIRFEESGHKDFSALSSVVKAVIRDKDGKPHPDLKGMSPEEFANSISATFAMDVFTEVSKFSVGEDGDLGNDQQDPTGA